jgi:hypothetical protein
MTKHTRLPIDELRSLLHYEPETGLLFRKKDSKPALYTPKGNGYLWGHVGGKLILAHRAAWAIAHGEWADVLDHINRVKTDNRIVNLRSVTDQINALNKGAVGGMYSPYRGVAYLTKKQRYTARLAGRYLGCFTDAASAARAYDQAAIRLGLPVALMNFPNEAGT